MKNIFQLLILLAVIIFFSFLGFYIQKGITGAILGAFTGLILVNTVYSIINFKKTKTTLRSLTILLFIIALAWFFVIL